MPSFTRSQNKAALKQAEEAAKQAEAANTLMSLSSNSWPMIPNVEVMEQPFTTIPPLPPIEQYDDKHFCPSWNKCCEDNLKKKPPPLMHLSNSVDYASRRRLSLDTRMCRSFAVPETIPKCEPKLVDHCPAYAKAYSAYIKRLKSAIRQGKMIENDLEDDDWCAIYAEKKKAESN